jgi:hypothetical protein
MVLLGHDQEMTGCHRVDVHEGDNDLILVYQGGRSIPGNDSAENAIRIGDHGQILLTARRVGTLRSTTNVTGAKGATMNRRISHLIAVAFFLAAGACGGASDEQTAAPASTDEVGSESFSATPTTTEGAAVSDSEESRRPTDLTEVPDAITPAPPPNDSEPVEPEPSEQPPAEDDPDAPLTVLPDPKVPAGFEALVASARADLATMLGVAESEVGVAVAESIVWPDAGLGCPQPDMVYAQVQVDGFRIVLTSGGSSYSYHGGGSQPEPFLCRRPTFP